MVLLVKSKMLDFLRDSLQEADSDPTGEAAQVAQQVRSMIVCCMGFCSFAPARYRT